MRTRSGANYPARLDSVYAAARDADGDEVRNLQGPVPNLWMARELRALYELDSAYIENRSATDENGKATVRLLAGDGSWARAEESTGKGHQSGVHRLWDDLERVRARWRKQAGSHSMTWPWSSPRRRPMSPARTAIGRSICKA